MKSQSISAYGTVIVDFGEVCLWLTLEKFFFGSLTGLKC
jgi:hypothetical protein